MQTHFSDLFGFFRFLFFQDVALNSKIKFRVNVGWMCSICASDGATGASRDRTEFHRLRQENWPGPAGSLWWTNLNLISDESGLDSSASWAQPGRDHRTSFCCRGRRSGDVDWGFYFFFRFFTENAQVYKVRDVICLKKSNLQESAEWRTVWQTLISSSSFLLCNIILTSTCLNWWLNKQKLQFLKDFI